MPTAPATRSAPVSEYFPPLNVRPVRVRVKTASFVAEFPLRTTAADERILATRLKAAGHLYNAVLGEVLRVLALMRESKQWQAARAMRKGPARTAAFRAVRERFDFKSSMADRFAIRCKNACWIGHHVGTHEAQKVALRAFQAVEQYALGGRGRPRFRPTAQNDSVEGKTNDCGLRFKDGALEWFGLRLPLLRRPTNKDDWQAQALACRTKYCRLLRRRLRGKDRWYLQLVQEGVSPLEVSTVPGAVVGLDVGPSTVAAVSADDAVLEQLCPGVVQPWQESRRLQRAMDRSRRATNPGNFDGKGRARKGPKKWVRSPRYQKLGEQQRETERRLAAERKRAHGELANRIVAQGNIVRTERLSYAAFQASFGRSSKVRGIGLFIALLRRKALAAGGRVEEFGTATTRLSQYDHATGTYTKKPLSQRWHLLGDGSGEVQRDLYSAFLARHVVEGTLDARSAAEAFPAAGLLLRRAASRGSQPASRGGFPHPHARERVGVGRPPKRDGTEHKAGDGVAARRGPRRALEETGPHGSTSPPSELSG